ncbi:MAG: LysR substrate-binding domain-containing protein [Pseudomonadales bacterium]
MIKYDRRHLPLNALRAFEAAAQHCHLGDAARQLGVTQGAVSQQVRGLEAQIEQPLFIRKHKRLSLTPAGRRLLDSVSEGLDVLSRGLEQLETDSQRMEGELVVCSTPSITHNMLISVIGRFSQDYPEVRVKLLQIAPSCTALPPEFDVCISFGRPEQAEGLVLRKLMAARFYPVASPALMLNRPAIELEHELLEYPLLHDRSDGWRTWFAQFAQGQREGVSGNTFFSDNYQVLMAARMGHGVGLAEYYEIAEDLAAGQLVLLNSQGVETAYDSYLILPPEARQTRRSQVFVDYIEQHLSAMASYFPNQVFD